MCWPTASGSSSIGERRPMGMAKRRWIWIVLIVISAANVAAQRTATVLVRITGAMSEDCKSISDVTAVVNGDEGNPHHLHQEDLCIWTDYKPGDQRLEGSCRIEQSIASRRLRIQAGADGAPLAKRTNCRNGKGETKNNS